MVTVAILCGGQSQRMGADKSFVMFQNRPVFEHVLRRVETLTLPVILITNTAEKYASYHLPMVSDTLANMGALGGLYTAIDASVTRYTLCVACDMPFLNTALLHYLVTLCDSSDIISPRIGGYPETMHTIYQKSCLEPIRQQLAQGDLKASGFFDKVKVRYVDTNEIRSYDPELRSFINLNTPADLAAASLLLPD